MPQEAAMVHKFIEVVKKRKEGKEGAGVKTLRETLETKRAMRALQLEPEEEEDAAAGAEEEEVYTIEHKGQVMEFKLGAACKVLYDDGVWYPGAVCSYTETTHKFRFKLTEGSNTRFA